MHAPSLILTALLLAQAGAGCSIRDFDRYTEGTMVQAPRANYLGQSDFFDDEGWDRNLVSGVVWHGQTSRPTRPPAVSRPLLERGRESYAVHCSPCHGLTGQGSGMVVQRGYPKPPSYHSERLRSAPDSHFYRVLMDGLGKMPPHAARVPRFEERWAIVYYIRALQISRNGRLDQVPPDERPLIERSSPGARR